MANLDAPRGLKPVRYMSGQPYSGAVTEYRIEAATILGVGDPVVLTGSSSTAGTNGALKTGIPLVDRASAASGTITGVVMWVEKDASSAGRQGDAKHFAAADEGKVFVADEPNLIFVIQEDSDANNLVVGDVGEGVDITITDADTNTGYSKCEIDSSTSAAQTGNADQLRVMRLADRPDNELGANADWEVLINEHTYKAAQTMI
jgi:hypothetical protein